jgi:ABC-type taurine transport system ATPase subunit
VVEAIRHEVGAGLLIGEDVILIRAIDTRERLQQIAKVDFGAAYTAGDEIQGVDADSHLAPRLRHRESLLRRRVVRVQARAR